MTKAKEKAKEKEAPKPKLGTVDKIKELLKKFEYTLEPGRASCGRYEEGHRISCG